MNSKTAILKRTLVAAVALLACRFIGENGNYAAAAGNASGVSDYDASVAGDHIAVDTLGTTIVEAGGAIAVGASVEVGATGKAVTKAAGVTVGRALTASAADGDKIEILLIHV